MGNFRIVIDAVGGHGCQRDRKNGEAVYGCRQMSCPDCMTAEFIESLKRKMTVQSAELIHWPDQPSEVRDEFVVTGQGPVTRIRHGNF